VEPSTGESFTDVRRGQTLLGVGVRKKWGFKVYAIALYADRSAAQRLRPGDHGGVVAGSFAKTIEIRLSRDLPAEKLRAAFEDALARPTGDSAAYRRFLACFEGTLPKGTVILLETVGGELRVTIGGTARANIVDRPFAMALVGVWLGPDPIDRGLRESLLSLLGRP
jgi:hypothetical protein